MVCLGKTARKEGQALRKIKVLEEKRLFVPFGNPCRKSFVCNAYEDK